jgi:hypothetical protein
MWAWLAGTNSKVFIPCNTCKFLVVISLDFPPDTFSPAKNTSGSYDFHLYIPQNFNTIVQFFISENFGLKVRQVTRIGLLADNLSKFLFRILLFSHESSGNRPQLFQKIRIVPFHGNCPVVFTILKVSSFLGHTV